MEASKIINVLESRIAIIPGGCDHEGRPLLFVIAFSETQSTATLDKFDTLLQYLASLFCPDTRTRGLCVVVDATRGPWRIARNVVKQVSTTLGSDIGCLLVLRHDAFWDNCTRGQRDEPIFLPISRLQKYIDISQLPMEYGGVWSYDHTSWIANRIGVEEFVKDTEQTIAELERLRAKLTGSGVFRLSTAEDILNITADLFLSTKHLAQKTISIGESIIQRLNTLNGQDQKDTKDRIERLMQVVRGKLSSVEDIWLDSHRRIIDAQEVDALEDGVKRVTDWILGVGESMLIRQQDVGYDINSAEDLRQAHNAVELQCRETYGHYAELVHKIDQLIQNGVQLTEDLKSQREFMDFVCRSFATRLERRRNILITSSRFFRLVSEYFQTTSEVYEQLVMSCDLDTLESTHSALTQLQSSQETIDEIELSLVREGEKLSDLLSMPIKDSFGRDLGVNYENDIVNVKEILDMTSARKSLFKDSVELQRLTLQQATFIYSYEKDAAQAVEWLEDLYNVMCKHHCHVGCTDGEIQVQKDQHQVLQETAKSTFEYGCQLLTAALSLRQSCKFTEDHTQNLSSCLYKCWDQLTAIGQEQLTRLRVSAVFYRTVKQQCNDLHELMDLAKSDLIGTSRGKVRKLLANRERLLLEIGRMVRLGRLLKSRLREPLSSEHEVEDLNESAVETISDKLAEVALLAEELDKVLCTNNVIKPQENKSNIIKWYSEKEEATLSTDRNDNETDQKDAINISQNQEFECATERLLTPLSRSSSFHTASDGDPPSPWWDIDPPSDPEQEQVSRNVDHNQETNSATLKIKPEIHPEVNNNKIDVANENDTLDLKKTLSRDLTSSPKPNSIRTDMTVSNTEYSLEDRSVSPATSIVSLPSRESTISHRFASSREEFCSRENSVDNGNFHTPRETSSPTNSLPLPRREINLSTNKLFVSSKDFSHSFIQPLPLPSSIPCSALSSNISLSSNSPNISLSDSPNLSLNSHSNFLLSHTPNLSLSLSPNVSLSHTPNTTLPQNPNTPLQSEVSLAMSKISLTMNSHSLSASTSIHSSRNMIANSTMLSSYHQQLDDTSGFCEYSNFSENNSEICESSQSTSSSGFHESSANITPNSSSCIDSSVHVNTKTNRFQQLTKQALTGVF